MPLFSRRQKTDPSHRATILFTTDLHGSSFTFRKLLRALELWKPTALVVGGDVAGKAMLPVADEGNGHYRFLWMDQEQEVSTAEELKNLEEKASQLGFYPYRAPMDEINALRSSPERAQEVFERLIYERWAAWLDQLEDKCRSLSLPAYVMAGNDDPWSLDEVTFAERKWVQGADRKVLPLLDDWVLLSCGLGNPTPWHCPRDTPEEELEGILRDIAKELSDSRHVVSNVHVPPYGSSLDLAPRLDTSVSPPRPITGEVAPVGSTAVRSFLEEFQPLVSLHGHIHESPGAVNIGRTRVINPGSEYAEGVLRAALVTLEPGRVLGEQFVAA